MRLLFTTQPAYGHLHPLLPLAEAARSAGHQVAIAASALFAPVVESAGFEAIAAGLNWLEADKSTLPAELKPRPNSSLEEYFAQQFVRAPARPMATDLIGLATSWRPDAIVRDRTEFGGAIAAAAIGIPCVAVQVGNPSLITPAVLEAIEPPYNDARSAVGLGADVGLSSLEAQAVLLFAPPGFHDPQVPLPTGLMYLRPDTVVRSAAPATTWTPPFRTGRPVVYATLGTVFNNPAFELPFFPAVLEGLRQEPVDLVITVGPNVDPAILGEQPASVHVARYIPQHLLLPTVDLVVSHGGFGTVLAAVEHGVPMIVAPLGADQHLNAAGVERLGIGIVIDEDEVRPQRVREAVRAILGDPRYRERARRLRDVAARLPPPEAAVEVIESLVSAGA